MKPKAVYNKSTRYDCISFVISSYRFCGGARLIIVDFYDRRNEFSLGSNHDFTPHTFLILIIDVFYHIFYLKYNYRQKVKDKDKR